MQKLTGQQRDQWAIDGYLHLKGALDPDEVALFSEELDRVRLEPGYEPSSQVLGHYEWLDHTRDTDPEGFMDRRDLLDYGQAFINLIDRSNVFDLIVDIMGPHIMLSMTQAIVRPSTETFPGYTHTDGGEGLREIRVTETSVPIAMKALYLLGDTLETGTGAFTLYPGSHMRPFPWQREEPLTPETPGAIQIPAEAGDCVLFPHALWHGPSANTSGRARKTLLYNYCQMFVRSYDHETTPEVAGRCSPRQRRLLGDLGYGFRPGSYFYVPQDQEAVIYDDGRGTTEWSGPQVNQERT
ncbi:MAG: phytanoyl-CoA dioxygenase family protein [Actinomycetia bacterium]|nr:phytanoyl-CoA dioxygenase family protein [Actinomycetes bacterium]